MSRTQVSRLSPAAATLRIACPAPVLKPNTKVACDCVVPSSPPPRLTLYRRPCPALADQGASLSSGLCISIFGTLYRAPLRAITIVTTDGRLASEVCNRDRADHPAPRQDFRSRVTARLPSRTLRRNISRSSRFPSIVGFTPKRTVSFNSRRPPHVTVCAIKYYVSACYTLCFVILASHSDPIAIHIVQRSRSRASLEACAGIRFRILAARGFSCARGQML